MGKLLVENLVALFLELFNETDQSNIFENQIATLKNRGVPVEIVKFLENQKSAVLAKASKITIGDGNLPFLPVIPRTFRSPYDLMAMVRIGGKTGYIHLNPTQISDLVETPSDPYYIYDVEDGSATWGKSPEDAEKIFRQQKRFPLTAAEVIALPTHTDVLSKHNVWAAGSRYVSANEVPYVYLDYSGRPGLGWLWINSSSGRLGSASCSSRGSARLGSESERESEAGGSR